MNEYDSAKIADIMVAVCDFKLTEDPKHADLIILNTCSIRGKAEEKLFSDLGRFRKFKNKNPNLIIGVGGCVAVQEKEKIFRRAPYVNLIFGPQTLHHLPKMYEQALQGHKKIIDVSFPKIEKFDYFPEPRAEGPTAYVSIMEGCNKFCSYCIVPYTRGEEISRPASDILKEIDALAKQGAKEIHLLGQNVNAYHHNKDNLVTLIRAIAKTEIERIRFTTSHPAEFTDELIAVFAEEPKLVSHLHLPVQSGSNRILELMRRGYTAEDYQKIISKLRQARPNIHISSDFIVGFPGETAENFDETMQLIRAVNFDASYSFIYSPRPGTPAAQLKDDVQLSEKKERLAILQNQIGLQAQKYSQAMIGTNQKILVTGSAKKDSQQFSGRTENNRVVNFNSDENVFGKIVTIKITEAMPNSLRGTVLRK